MVYLRDKRSSCHNTKPFHTCKAQNQSLTNFNFRREKVVREEFICNYGSFCFLACGKWSHVKTGDADYAFTNQRLAETERFIIVDENRCSSTINYNCNVLKLSSSCSHECKELINIWRQQYTCNEVIGLLSTQIGQEIAHSTSPCKENWWEFKTPIVDQNYAVYRYGSSGKTTIYNL